MYKQQVVRFIGHVKDTSEYTSEKIIEICLASEKYREMYFLLSTDL